MDKIEKLAIVCAAILLSVFFFAVWDARKKGVTLPNCLPPGTAFTEGKLVKLSEKEYQVFYVSKMWTFIPARIEIPAGSRLDIFLISADVVHGLQVVRKNVNMMAVNGAVNFQSVQFDKPGVYPVVCHEYCGIGHQFMQAEIAVR